MAVDNQDIKKSVKKVNKKLNVTSKKLEEKDQQISRKIKKNESKLKAQDQKDLELQAKIKKNRERVVNKGRKLEGQIDTEKKAKRVIKKDLSETKERVDELERLIKGKFAKAKAKPKAKKTKSPKKVKSKKTILITTRKKKNEKKIIANNPTEIKIVLPETKVKKVKNKRKPAKKTIVKKPKKTKTPVVKIVKSSLVSKTKLKAKEQEKEIKELKRKIHKKNKIIDKLTLRQKEIYDNRQKETEKLTKEILELKKKTTIKDVSLESKVKKLEKENETLIERLKKKNQKFMESLKVTNNQNLQEQDLQFILGTAQRENENVLTELDKLKVVSKSLEVELERALEKVNHLEREVNKKSTIIDILEKGDVDVNGLVQAEIEKTKVRWLGWPEGGIIEEIDLVLANHSNETLHDIHVELDIKKDAELISKAKQLPVKRVLKPKEILKYKVNLFKYLKHRGEYQIEVRVFSNNPVREFGIIEKTISL